MVVCIKQVSKVLVGGNSLSVLYLSTPCCYVVFPLQGQGRVQVTELIQKANIWKNVSVPANSLHCLYEGKSFFDHEVGQCQSR